MKLQKLAIVVHSNLDNAGGAERCCLNVIQILEKRFENVLVIHAGLKTDINEISSWADIRFSAKVQVKTPNISKILAAYKLSLLEYSCATRSSFKYFDKADLVFGSFGEYTLNKSNVFQFVHFPIYFSDKESLECLGVNVSSWLNVVFRSAYVRLCRLISGWDPRVVSRNITFTNSEWTARKIREKYPAINCQIAYPGVSLGDSRVESKPRTFDNRQNAFVMVGRIVANKRVEEAIKIISRIVELHPGFVFYIVGSGGGRYYEKIKQLAAEFPFVKLIGAVSKSELEMLISSVKYGIHCYRNEHYGIAAAEMQQAGCIVFVHDSGGQTEVICDPRQRYLTTDDAIRKICDVVNSRELQIELFSKFEVVNKKMTIDGFYSSIVEGLEKYNCEKKESF